MSAKAMAFLLGMYLLGWLVADLIPKETAVKIGDYLVEIGILRKKCE